MLVLPDPLAFDWDIGNTDKNLKKHRVTALEAEEAFDNKPLIINKDTKHSATEQRYQVLGWTDKKRKLFISFTVRRDKVRIISARDMNRKEEIIYDQEI